MTEEVFLAQREFLDKGAEALHPLPMADVAAKVGVHVATVSRAVAGKYVQTPRGIFPLRMFFSGGKASAGGEDMAWDAIRVKLKEVVDAEDKAAPLNDDQLVAALKAHGLARDTEEVLELTPLGAFFADEVAQQFHHPDFIPYPRSEYVEGPLSPYLNTEVF